MKELNIKEWKNEFNWEQTENKEVHKEFFGSWESVFRDYQKFITQAQSIVAIINQIKEEGKVDLEKNYIFFGNSSSIGRPYYEDFRICDIETHKVLLTIKCNCETGAKFKVLGRLNLEVEFSNESLFECETPEELNKWLNTK